MMNQSISLSEAVQTLATHAGRRFAASRDGGAQRFTAILCDQHGLPRQEAQLLIARLARCRAIDWIAEPSLSQPCPGLLELFGDWIIEPDRAA